MTAPDYVTADELLEFPPHMAAYARAALQHPDADVLFPVAAAARQFMRRELAAHVERELAPPEWRSIADLLALGLNPAELLAMPESVALVAVEHAERKAAAARNAARARQHVRGARKLRNRKRNKAARQQRHTS